MCKYQIGPKSWPIFVTTYSIIYVHFNINTHSGCVCVCVWGCTYTLNK